MNISIAIVDKDKDYVARLVEVLQEYEDLNVSVFTNVDLLEETLLTKKIDVVLFDPDVSDSKISLLNAKMWICLYSDEARNTSYYTDCEKVIKYQRISKIYKEVIKAYADKVGSWVDFDRSQNTKIIGVYSPIGGSGKTTVAFSLASKFSSFGKKVLYLSLEQLDASGLLNPRTEEEDGITQLFEAIGENINFELKLKGITKKGFNDIYYVEGFERIIDYNTITSDEMKEVIERIKKSGSFDIIILDMGSALDSLCEVCLEISDSLVLVEKAGEIAAKKIEMFATQVFVREWMGKMFKVCNFMENNAILSNRLDVPNIGNIPNFGTQTFKNVIQMITNKDVMNVNTILK
ncbi:MAG: AAA family ATPase [Lachnospiraceae bacterium]|nr:AAA family ATPase [Lachnospiraceae bacterium]